MKKVLICILLFLNFNLVCSQELDTIYPHLDANYQVKISHLIECFKNNDKEKIGDLIVYPLSREYPVSDIKNRKEFISRFDEIFDDTLIKMIISSNPALDWSEVGWRGIMLLRGEIWVNTDGEITGINYQTTKENNIKNKLIATDKKSIHSSLSTFERPVYILETTKFRIRIDDLGESNYRYASWPISKSMSEKPDLIILKGEFIWDGTGGNHKIVFNNAGYIYECSIIIIGLDDSPPAILTVTKKGKNILTQKAKIID